ncbi:hypothetical protein Tco_0596856 [Tanacetum coccineum]
MANLSSYGSYVLSEVPHSETYQNDMANKSVQAKSYFEQTPDVDYLDNEITSDSNIIPYSQYLLETQQAAVQDTNSSTQQDSMILYVVEQMTDHVANLDKENQTNKMVNESLTAELEKYKERVAIFEQRLNIDLKKRELPKVSLVNESLKKLKYHLASFDKVVKKRTTSDAITADVVNIVMHADVKFYNVLPVPNTFLDDNIALDVMKMENDHLMELLVSQDLVHTAVNSLTAINEYKSMEQSYLDEYNENLKLTAELAKKNDMIEKSVYNELSKKCSRLEQRCISLELKLQHNKESFQNDKSCENPNAPKFQEFFEINEPKAQLQAKDTTISNLKKHIQELKGKSVSDCNESMNKLKVVSPTVLKLDLEPLFPKLKNNREAHVDYIRINKENANTLSDIVEQDGISNPLDNALAYACMYTKQIQELLVFVSDTCPNFPLKSNKLVAVTPMNKARKVTFAKTSTTS